jgi:hypothetical protein
MSEPYRLLFKSTRSRRSSCEPAVKETVTVRPGRPQSQTCSNARVAHDHAMSDEGTQIHYHCLEWHSGHWAHSREIESLWACQLISTGSCLRKRWPTHYSEAHIAYLAFRRRIKLGGSLSLLYSCRSVLAHDTFESLSSLRSKHSP